MNMRMAKSWVFTAVFLVGGSSAPVRAMHPALERAWVEIFNDEAMGHETIVVTDLDETVIDSMNRRYFSLRNAGAELCGEDRSGDCGKIAGINVSEFLSQQNLYDQLPLYRKLGIPASPWRDRLEERKFDIYLSGAHLELDQAIPGAVEYIQLLRESGATIFFVSSRWKDTQGKGTVASLRDLGMLGTDADAESRVILRERGTSSIDFKRQSFARISKWAADHHASVELVMENEPENMNAMTREFPDARAVFVGNAWLKDEALINNPRLIRIKNFR